MNGQMTITRETYHRASELMAVLYGWSCVGGPLHIITDDHNTRNSDIDFCRQTIDSYTNYEHRAIPNEVKAACHGILDILEPMTFTDRYWLVTHAHIPDRSNETLDDACDHWFPKDGGVR